MRETNSYAELIGNRLHELGVRIHDIDTELAVPKDFDLGEQAIDLEDDEVLEGLGTAAQAEVRLLKSALQRLSAGTFGVCLECNQPISKERLVAVPYAPLCKVCARAGEG